MRVFARIKISACVGGDCPAGYMCICDYCCKSLKELLENRRKRTERNDTWLSFYHQLPKRNGGNSNQIIQSSSYLSLD